MQQLPATPCKITGNQVANGAPLDHVIQSSEIQSCLGLWEFTNVGLKLEVLQGDQQKVQIKVSEKSVFDFYEWIPIIASRTSQ